MIDFKYEGKLLFPRLPQAAARKQLEENRKLSIEQLVLSSESQHPAAAPAPVGGHPASANHLHGLQIAIRRLAQEYGFPNALTSMNQAAFERECGSLLLREMDIVPGDAASGEVWSFMSLVLVPEVPFWRFPNAADQRYLGGDNRNTFHRLWWRAFVLGPDLASVDNGRTPFGEDDFVQVMERTAISGNRRLAQLFQKVVLSTDHDALKTTRSDLVRKLAVQVRAHRAHMAFDLLDEADLERYIERLRDELFDLSE